MGNYTGGWFDEKRYWQTQAAKSYEVGFKAEDSYVLNQIKWDRRFLELARHISGWSKDPSTKTGSVIVDNERTIVSMGYNGFPRGVLDSNESYNNRDVKYNRVMHAERNALDLSKSDLKECILYCTHPPCEECQKSIIQKGIKRVVWYKPTSAFASRWKSSFRMMEEAGISYNEYEPTTN